MTGTPIQNSLDDLASLVRFLRVPQLEDATVFQRHITRRQAAGRVAKPNYGNLKLLLGSICLRRSTSSILSSLGVISVEHRPSFSLSERKAYDDLVLECEKSIKAAINSRPTKNNQSILTAMLKLRIFCNMGLAHPAVANPEPDVEGHFLPDEEISLLLQRGDAICSKCKNEIVTPDIGYGSLEKRAGSWGSLKCAVCSHRDLETAETANPSVITDGDPMEGVEMEGSRSQDSIEADGSDPVGNQEIYPTKLVALLADIREHYSKDKRYDRKLDNADMASLLKSVKMLISTL